MQTLQNLKNANPGNSKVPEQFRTQYPAYGNPPTLAMGVTAYIKRLKGRASTGTTPDNPFSLESDIGIPTEDMPSLPPSTLSSVYLASPSLARSFLTSVYPKLRSHYHWFRRTQRGQIREWGREVTGGRSEAYRWRGRSMDHVLTSGIDDYPRAKPPHVGELHLDLMSWMGYFTRSMKDIAAYIGENEDVKEYEKLETAILTNLDGEELSQHSSRVVLMLRFLQNYIGVKRTRCIVMPA